MATPKTILDYLMEDHSEDIIDNASDIGFGEDDFEGYVESAEVKNRFRDLVLAHPERVLQRIPDFELQIIEDCIKTKDCSVRFPHLEYMPILSMCGLADKCEELVHGDLVVKVEVAKEFLDACAPVIASVRQDPKLSSVRYVERILFGMLNIYGVATYRQMIDCVRTFFDSIDAKDTDAEQYFDFVFDHSAKLRFCLIPGIYDEDDSEQWTFGGEYCDFIDGYVKDQKKKGLRKPVLAFTRDELLAASAIPDPVIPNKHQKTFTDYLKNILGASESAVKVICQELYVSVQDDDFKMQDYVGYLFNDRFGHQFSSMDDVQRGLNILMNYINNIPRWSNGGYTPEEAHAKTGR